MSALASRSPSSRRSRRSKLSFCRFAAADDGAAMIEAIIIAPVVMIFLAGILEFGGVLVSKLEVETGLRDAARYLARCSDAAYGCTPAQAINIAVYGVPTVPDPAPPPRVAGWQPSDVLIDDPSPILVPNGVDGDGDPLYRGPANIYVVRVSTDFDYAGGVLLGMVGQASIRMAAFHEERFIGW